MGIEDRIKTFVATLAEISVHSSTAQDRPLRWFIIVNPKAGGFTIPSRWNRHRSALNKALVKARTNPLGDAGPCGFAGEQGVVLTKGRGHAGKEVKDFLDALSETPQKGEAFYLIIAAGGDGTSREILNALYAGTPESRSQCGVLRLPLGTGNDGADAWELDAALDLLIRPSKVVLSRALRLTTAAGKGRFYAFNILSVGIDAFVTHMTNKMKGNLPGDSYKLWVDIGALFYDRLYQVGPIRVQAFDEAGNPVKSFRETLLLLAMGVSGHRTYGSHKRILPDERNVCALKQMSLLRKLTLKELCNTGAHSAAPESIMFNAHRIEVEAEYPILAQMDGETLDLGPKDFPAVLELTEPAIPILVLC
ncbi:MAG: diacylglycerol kinase [Treponema sp.]|jgi:diacylglycerol kinase family enzyme|nr:diacylglycerol kinase [Treponema sp.]